MKIAFGMIILNGNYVLQQVLESVYPFASQILIAEGPVKYWQDQKVTTSTDGTNEILDNFPDPEHKITIVHSQYTEKNEQCNAYMQYVNDDIDYIWNLDSDEIFKPEDILTIITQLKQNKYTTVAFQSVSFYGGFDHYLTGFEEAAEFIRIRKIYPGSYWSTHRPPTIAHRISPLLPEKKMSMNISMEIGIKMYHYSYVFPQQVLQKTSYYKSALTKQNGIDNYFYRVYLPWVTGNKITRDKIEEEFCGVHDFIPAYRGDCYTAKFEGQHPEIINKNMSQLKQKFQEQLNELENW